MPGCDEEEEYDEEWEEDEFIVEGLIKLDDFNKNANINAKITSEDYESLGGYVMGRLDRLAKVGDIIETDELTIVVDKMDKNRIDKLHVFKKHKDIDEDTK